MIDPVCGMKVTPETAAPLRNLAWHLRTVEHRVQMVEDAQTHLLPAEPAALDNVASNAARRVTPGAFSGAGISRALSMIPLTTNAVTLRRCHAGRSSRTATASRLPADGRPAAR